MSGGKAWPEPEKYRTPKIHWAWEGHKVTKQEQPTRKPQDGKSRKAYRREGQAYCHTENGVWYHYKCKHVTQLAARNDITSVRVNNNNKRSYTI